MLPLGIVLGLIIVSVAIAIINNKSIAKGLTLVSFGAGFVASIMMVIQTAGGNIIKYQIGQGVWNVQLEVGMIEAFMSCLFTGIGFLIMWASCTMIEHDVEEKKIPLYYTMICFLVSMLCGVVFFDNLINIYIFIELSSFAAAGIVIIKNQPENIRAGLKYLTLSILGSGLVLMGVVILYSMTVGVTGSSGVVYAGGALSITGIRDCMPAIFEYGAGNVTIALIFVTAGVCFKSALFPFHIWLPDAHGTAPSPSSAMLSSLVLKAYIVFYMKMLFVAVGQSYIKAWPGLQSLVGLVLVMGCIAMLAGSCMAILQTDIKRMIAYSSVAQIGYIFMGIGLGSELGLYAAFFHILAHAVTKAGLFLIAGSIIEQTHNRRLDKMGGLGIEMPVTMAMFTIGSLSMVGIPLFVGFNSKWNFAVGIMQSGQFWVMIVLAISSLLNALYYLPVVIRAFFGTEAREKAANRVSKERPIAHLAPIMILSALVILIAVAGKPVTNYISEGIGNMWGEDEHVVVHLPEPADEGGGGH